jgi:phenylacetate-CoA ligase
MARVSGRTDNMLIVRGVNVYPSEIERVLRGTPGIAPLYHVIVDRRGALDALEVQVEVSPEFTSGAADLGALIALRDRLNDALDAALGLSTEVVIHPPDSLPRGEGKAMRIQDRRTL